MIGLIAGIVIIVVVTATSVVVYFNDLQGTHGSFGGIIWATFVGLFWSSIVAVFINLILGVPAGRPHDKTIDLVALSNSSETSGRFFLGSGYVNGDSMYVFMVREDDGGIVLNNLEASYGKIYEIPEGKTPYAVQEISCTNPTLSVFYACESGKRSPHRFYIPAGSVWSGYDVDVRK